jgi:sporulation protein YlmC with PRC-barrel domain
VRASALIGREIFGPDNESIGEVSDIILEEDGKTRAALVDVGGFLGVGEKEVAIPFDDLQVTADGDEPRVSVAMTKEELEQAPAFEDDTVGSDQAEQTATADQPAATDQQATADQAAPADQQQAAFAAATQDLSAEDLIGSAVYSPNEESIGEVGDVVFDQGGEIEAVVVDVGGFLGVGEKPVAVQFDALNVQKDMNGDMRLMVNATQEQLENAPAYDANAAAEGQAQPAQ